MARLANGHFFRFVVEHVEANDVAAMRAMLETFPRHRDDGDGETPLWNNPALEIASPALRGALVEHGADDGTVFTALLLGDEERARAMVEADPALLAPETERSVLMHALSLGRDDFACGLLDAGAAPEDTTDDGFSALAMAANWGCFGDELGLPELRDLLRRRVKR